MRRSAWLDERKGSGHSAPNVRFDVSAVVLEEESEGVPATTDEEAAALAKDLRRLGLDRIVFGSDAPVFRPDEYQRQLSRRVDFEPGEMADVLSNHASLFDESASEVK